jgi:hypothetical protein
VAQKSESELALAENRIATAEERIMDLMKSHESKLTEAWDSARWSTRECGTVSRNYEDAL